MAAPKNNQFWKLRSKHGRDKIFESPELFKSSAYEYFDYCDSNPWNKMEAIKSGPETGKLIAVPTQKPYSIKGLCIFLGITEQTFLNYESNENYKDFFEVFTHIRDIIENNQMEGATVGAYNANIVARKLGLVDGLDIKHSGGIKTTNITALNEEEQTKINELIERFKNESD